MNSILMNYYENWMKWDKNEQTRSQIIKLKETKNWTELENILLNRIQFGTAGLRSAMGPGNARMNDLIIIQTTQGLLKFAQSTYPNLNTNGVIIGFDQRLNSERWGKLTANIFLNAHCPVYMSDSYIPTPFVAFGVRYLKTCLGIMITASHNPKNDNGYKVYMSNGAQLVDPHDKAISNLINLNLEPWPNSWNIEDDVNSRPGFINPMPDLLNKYCELQKENVCFSPSTNPNSKLQFVYTAMHGVGWEFVQAIVKQFNLPKLIPVEEQIVPDGTFPTVDFPNPEEGRSALNLAIRKADSIDCPLILANDPDADRLAVAEKQSNGTWKIFKGNELGALLGWWMWTNWRQLNSNEPASKVAMLSSTVSSKILQSMAKIEGFQFFETLTGFKWMGNESDKLLQNGIKTLFAFEEAIGFMCGDLVLDKDGVGTLAVMIELTNHVYSQSNMLLSDQLDVIYEKYGLHISNNGYYFCYDSSKIASMFERIRNWPHDPYPRGYVKKLGPYLITSIRDLTVGYDDNYEDLKPRLPVDKNSQNITFGFENGVTLTLRTSGTEPKIKFYSELVSKPNVRLEDKAELKKSLDGLIELMIRHFYEPEKNNFQPSAN